MSDTLFDVAELDPAPEPPEPSGPPPEHAATERGLLDALRHRYSHRDYGLKARYVVAEQVRSHASYYARRTADFVALDTWESGKYAYHGHEVKVSRSDWLRELKAPEKAAEFVPYMNYWWIVVPDAAIVRPAELPETWGLMALAGGQLKAVTRARWQAAEPMETRRLVAFMRAVRDTAEAHR